MFTLPRKRLREPLWIVRIALITTFLTVSVRAEQVSLQAIVTPSTTILKDGRVVFAIGSPGGPTIINTVFQVIVNVLDFRMNLQQAIDAPRYHHQWMPDHIRWEPYGLNADTRKALEARGHQFADKPGYMGDAEGVMIEPQTGMRLGASDPRLGGAAVGY